MLVVEPVRNRDVHVVPPVIARFVAADQQYSRPSRIERQAGHCANLVTMTRSKNVKANAAPQPPLGRWRLQDAKARFSELVRLAHSDGPQHVTLHGRDAVVVIDANEFRRLKGGRTGQLLIDAIQASPHRNIEIVPRRSVMPVRDVRL